MDSLDTVAFARSLIDIDSTTGREAEAGQWLARQLRALGYTVLEQRGRARVRQHLRDARRPGGRVLHALRLRAAVLSQSASRTAALIGRGACDAKGILAAQVAAAERLRASGERRVGLLFVVGEERGSDGAVAANTIANSCRYLINGEPTDSKLGKATRGNLRVRLAAEGRAAHSAAPEQGESAIEKLIDALVELRGLPLPVDPDLGATFYTVGLIEGGVAPNVIPARASAEVMFRTIGRAEDILAVLRALERRVTISEVLRVRPIRMHTVEGFETARLPVHDRCAVSRPLGRAAPLRPGIVSRRAHRRRVRRAR